MSPVMLATASLSWCPIYRALSIRTKQDDNKE
ncbi:YgaP family membrane protein [Duganella sp. LjRoot269]